MKLIRSCIGCRGRASLRAAVRERHAAGQSAALHVLVAARWRRSHATRRHDQGTCSHARPQRIARVATAAGERAQRPRARPPRDSRDGRHVSRDVRFPGSHAVRRAGRPKAPYQSWGTEKVYVDSDTGRVHQPRAHSRDAHRAARRQDQRADGDEALAAGLGVPAGSRSSSTRATIAGSAVQLASGEGFRRWRADRVSGRRIAALCEPRQVGAHGQLLHAG